MDRIILTPERIHAAVRTWFRQYTETDIMFGQSYHDKPHVIMLLASALERELQRRAIQDP